MHPFPLKNVNIASLISSAGSLTAAEMAQLERLLAMQSPGTFAQLISRGRWLPARHLSYLDQALVESIEAAGRGEQEGLVVSMPPQNGKSELCSKHLPAWYLGLYPDRRVLLVGYETDFAASWGRKARDLLDQHGHLFGVRVSKRSAAATRWDLDGHEGGMMTAGMGGAITGKGAHLLIIDDPVKNDEEARSATTRERQWEWFQSVARTRLRPGGLIVVIQTRWHRDDLTGRILEQARQQGHRWRQVKFPAIAEQNDELGRRPGEALWPEMYPVARLESVKEGCSPYYWRALYQQDPQAEGGTEWPAEYFGPHIWFNRWPDYYRIKTVALDPSKGADSKSGDYSAFVMVGLAENGNLYIDAELRRIDCALLAERALEISRSFQPQGFGVEANQLQVLLSHEIQKLSQQRGIFVPLWNLNNTLNKQVRIRQLTPWLAQKRMRFKADSPGARLLVRQLEDFPIADHDDGPDGLEMAVRLMNIILSQPPSEPEPERLVVQRDPFYDYIMHGIPLAWHMR